MKTINGRMRPLANLAMGLALVAIPMQAMAQEGHGGGERGNRGGGAGAPAAPAGGGQRSAPAQGQPMGGGFGGGSHNAMPSWGGANPAPAARPAPAAPSAPAAPGGYNFNGGRGPERGAMGSGWNRGRSDAQPPRNDAPRMEGQRMDGQRMDRDRMDRERMEGRRIEGPRGGNESWRGTPGWPQGGMNRGPGMNAPRGDYRRWTQDWRRDNRYDWQRFRTDNRMTFHVGRYNPPYRGYAYRRLSVGLFLQPLFYSQSYIIYDPYNYRLPAVYGPYQWVRYYDDALLVDTYTGEVVDVLYDFFW